MIILQGYPGRGCVERTHPGEGNFVTPWVQVTVTKHQIADLKAAKSRYQIGKLAIADCRIGKDWKTWLDICN